jgi:transketolase C-terminal domain/subunit
MRNIPSGISFAVTTVWRMRMRNESDAHAKEGISAAVVEYPASKPFDAGAIVRLAGNTGAAASVEERSVIGWPGT